MKNVRKIFVSLFAFLFLGMIVVNIKVFASELNSEANSKTIIQEISEDLFGNVSVKTVEYLYNLDESPDYVYVTFENSGYAIYSSSTLDLLEYSMEGNLPYPSGKKKYYGGPTQYINKIDSNFANISTGEVLSESNIDLFIEQSKEILLSTETQTGKTRKNQNLNIFYEGISVENDILMLTNDEANSSSNSGGEQIPAGGFGPGATYIDNYEYFMIGPHHGKNSSGTCSAVAAQILLSYHNYYSDRRIIDNKYLFTLEDGPNTCTNPMKMSSKIIGSTGIYEDGSDITNSYFAKVVSAIPKSSGAIKIVSGMREIINEREEELNISGDLATISWGLSSSKIKNEIDDGRPIIISMHYDDYSNHAVVGYGYQTLGGTGTEEDEQFGYIVHYGWATQSDWTYKTNIWINEAWCYNWVSMEVGHTHTYGETNGNYYERVCSCGHRISDYPFETSIYNGKVTINSAEFSAPSDFVIPSKIQNYPVANIASNAFKDQKNIENLKIPDCIETIGIGAFSGCSNLKEIILPFSGYSRTASDVNSNFGYIFGTTSYSGSTMIMQNSTAYYIPTNLRSVTITNANEIKSRTFENCNTLKEIILSNGITTIDDYAFLNCSSINDIQIPQTVSIIGDYVFSGCSKIYNMTIPYSVTSVGNNAFPSNIKIKWIYNTAITAASLGIENNITEVVVNTGISTINNDAFKNCINLKTVQITENVTNVSSTAFAGCFSITSFTLYHNPEYTISEIGSNLLNLVTNVYIPDGVYKIKDNAFKDCVSLRRVVIPSHVTEGGNNVFSGCTSLSSVTWYYNPNVTASDLKIQDVLTNVIFYKEVKGEDINSISANAFIGCTKLTQISIPDYIINIYNINGSTITGVDLSFAPISTQITIELPNKINKQEIKSIGNSSFEGKTNLKSITIPDEVTNISYNAFKDCTSLSSITLPNNLVAIGTSAFKGCSNLKVVYMHNKTTNIDSNAFENCSSLTSFTLSNSLVAIGTSAFKGCSSLKSISIPSSVTNIDSSAFENCSSLNNVIVLREIDDITHLGEKVFNGCSSSLQISVPQNRVAEYKNKIYWSSYKSKIIPNSNSFDEYELDCYRVFDIELTLNSKYNKLYKLNVNCAKNYKIVSTANSTVEMKIYDSNMNLVTSGNDLISHYLGKGVYYLDLRFVDDEDSGVITTTFQLTWPVSKYDISMGNTNLLTHLHENTNGNFINKLYLQSVNGEGFYKFTITGYDKNNNLIILPSNAIKVYRSGTTDEIINCYSMIDSSVFAENSENMNSLIVYLYDYLGFYIDICLPTNEYNSLTLNIQKVPENIVDLFELSESQDQNVLNFSGISLGDNLQKMVLKQAGRFELDTNGFSQGQFVVLKVRAIVDDTMVFAEPILYDLSLNNQYEFDMLEGTYYVGYIGTDLNVNLSCVLTRKVTIYGDSYLDPDPNFVGVNGSEVTLNGGLQYSNEITQGFTRVIYLTTGESRLDYYWYSSDENVARITDFGTVVGLNVNNDTSVKIMAVNIEDPSKVFVKEFIIKKDAKTFDSDPIERYGEIIIDTDVSNEAQIDLSELNVPINWLQYFTWSSSDSDLYVDQFGRIFVDEETIGNTYTITGTYKLNSRVKVYITVKVE